MSSQSRRIPARAGNTPNPRITIVLSSAHLRSRGEHSAVSRGTATCIGSSPLARGTRLCCGDSPLHGRLIPARAGNTSASAPHSPQSPAHPRSRGEHIKPTTTKITLVGSSPLARGTQSLNQHLVRFVRLIPARAGNTIDWWNTSFVPAAHPRSRGEHCELDKLRGF